MMMTLLMMKWRRTCCLCDLSLCGFFSKLFFRFKQAFTRFLRSIIALGFQNQTKTQSITIKEVMSTKSSSSSSSSSSQVYNKNHSAIKRLMSEIQELQRNPSPDYTAQPLEDNLFEWHFTVRGPPDTAFQDGIYHGRIILPSDYPFKPPDIMLLTPNGRFETNKKICLSVSSHHPESWMPAWGIRTVLLALIGFMPTEAKGIGAIDYSDEARRELARRSVNYHCETCGCHNRNALPAITTASTSSGSSNGGDSDANAVADKSDSVALGENVNDEKSRVENGESRGQVEEKQQTSEMNESDDSDHDSNAEEKNRNDDIQELNDATMTTRTISDHSSETIRTEKTDEERTTIPTETAATTTTRRVVPNDMTNSAVAQQQQSSSSPSSSTTRQRQSSSARTTRSVVVAKNDAQNSFNSGLLFLNLLIFLVAMGVGFVMYHKMTHFDHYREL